jgi:hypothetical protein
VLDLLQKTYVLSFKGHHKSPLHRITAPEAVLLNYDRDLKYRIHVTEISVTPLRFVVSNATISLYSQCTFTIFVPNLFASRSNSALSVAQLTKGGQWCDLLRTTY